MSKRNHLLVLAVLSMLLADAAQAASPPKNKPQPPVQVVITPNQQSQAHAAVKPGDEVPITVTVTPSTDATEMRITCTLSDGVELVTGALEWSGPTKKGEEHILTMTVRSPKAGKGKVVSRVELYLEGSLLITTNAEYELDAASMEKPQLPVGTRKDKKGRRVDEYR